jgi:hypothetical protein
MPQAFPASTLQRAITACYKELGYLTSVSFGVVTTSTGWCWREPSAWRAWSVGRSPTCSLLWARWHQRRPASTWHRVASSITHYKRDTFIDYWCFFFYDLQILNKRLGFSDTRRYFFKASVPGTESANILRFLTTRTALLTMFMQFPMLQLQHQLRNTTFFLNRFYHL